MAASGPSLVAPDVITQLQNVLSNLASNDNNLRSQAERELNDHWISSQPDLLLLSLAQLGCTHQNTHVRVIISI